MLAASGKEWLTRIAVWAVVIGLFVGLPLLDQYVEGRWPLKKQKLMELSARLVRRLRDRVSAHVASSSTPESGLIEVQRAYVAVLVSAARASGEISSRREQAIWRVAGRIQAANRMDLRVSQILADPKLAPGSVNGCARFAAKLIESSPDLTRGLAHDVFSVLFADLPLTESDRAWLRDFSSLVPWADVAASVLLYYDREPIASDRPRWLNELDLPLDADETAVRAAYRTLAMQYHPDRCAELPPHIRVLSERKMAAVNEAYGKLTDHRPTLFFGDAERMVSVPRTQERSAFICKCWLCEENNRVKPAVDLSVARCGKCWALLGLTFDPLTVRPTG